MEQRKSAPKLPIQSWSTSIQIDTNLNEIEEQCDRVICKLEKITSLMCDVQAMMFGNESQPPIVKVPMDEVAAFELARERSK